MMKKLLILVAILSSLPLSGQGEEPRWTLDESAEGLAAG